MAIETDVEDALRIVQAKDRKRRPLGELVSAMLRRHPHVRAELTARLPEVLK